MDRALDDIITERDDRPQRGPPRRPDNRRPPPRQPRREREEYPRDGVKKPYRAAPVNFESDWVHDRFDEDRFENSRRGPRDGHDQYDARGGRGAPADGGAKIRVDNVHYELTEDDLRSLFEQKGPTVSVRLMYDRMDRSVGTAYVVYEDARDARRAIADFDGQNANGQPIRLSLLPTGPSAGPRAPGGSMLDRIQKPERSMFERMERDRGHGYDSGDELGSHRRRGEGYGRRERSDSPRKSRPLADGVDRYVPSGRRGSRSPPRRRGTPREAGRRPGARRDDTGRGGRGGGGGGRRGGRTDDEGRPIVGGRPKKTADELDAEMEDYWGSKAANGNGDGAQNGGNGETADSTAVAPIDDIDMDV